MKRKITFFLCTVLFFSAQSWGQTWNLTSTMTAVLDNKGELTISTTKAEGEAMPRPGYGSLYDAVWYSVRDKIHSVSIKDKVTSICEVAFVGCSNLTSVTIPNSVQAIGRYAFYDCKDLTSVIIPTSVKSIDDSAFKNCSGLISIIIPESIHIIDIQVFNNCSNLTSVTIPNSIQSIENAAFSGCKRLTSVFIPSSISKIADNAFINCPTSFEVDSGNTFYSSDAEGVLYNKDKTVLQKYPEGKTNETFKIPKSVVSIGNSAFIYCNLTSLIIPNSIVLIVSCHFSKVG